MEKNITKLVKKIAISWKSGKREKEKETGAVDVYTFVKSWADGIEAKITNVQKAMKPVDGWMPPDTMVWMEEPKVFYHPKIACLVPKSRNFSVSLVFANSKKHPDVQKLSLEGRKADLPTEYEAALVYRLKNEYLQFANHKVRGIVYEGKNHELWCKSMFASEGSFQPSSYSSPRSYAIVPFVHLNGRDSDPLTWSQTLLLWWKNDLFPGGDRFADRSQIPVYQHLKDGYISKYPDLFMAKGDAIVVDVPKILEDLKQGKTYPFLPIKGSVIPPAPKSNTLSAEVWKDKLLHTDERRAALDPYDERILTDPKRGHWDLWDLDADGKTDDAAEIIDLGEGFWARNPVADVNLGYVAIDFGTKSTVVVYENEHLQRLPLQIGSGDYHHCVKQDDYENPTILELRDVNGFLSSYQAKIGRPDTQWEQVRCSHAAKDSLDHGRSDQYYSFFTGLKQWCASGNALRFLRDQTGRPFALQPFLYLDAATFNPVEVYAYYLGCYMNNMLQKGHIFLNYILSFPVTYSFPVRERIRQSFEDGLKKSLPASILSNEDVMKHFHVEEGVTEPAAYAVTALSAFGYEPEDGESVYYGVFDFGGGTTDFDYGVYRPSENDRFDYRLTHFGANGDKMLGGEHLLKLLAFQVFRVNRTKLLHPFGEKKGRVPFTYADEKEESPECAALIRESQEAEQNMHNLMEALRPVFEEEDGKAAQEIQKRKKVIVPYLYLEDGTRVQDFELTLVPDGMKDPIDLRGILRDRIEQGVHNFFLAMRQAFEQAEGKDGIPALKDIDKIVIFLAGNASRSLLVRELFEQYIGKKETFRSGQKFSGTQEKSRIIPSSFVSDSARQTLSVIHTLTAIYGRKCLAEEEEKASAVAEKVEPKTTPKMAHSMAQLLLGLKDDDHALSFELRMPLGTEEARIQQGRAGVMFAGPVAPTAKTGVAFGLLECRPGGSIEVVDLLPEGTKVPFQFYVGRSRRKKFQTYIGKDTPFGKWYKLVDASNTFDILYTDQPVAATNKMPREQAKKKTITPAHLDADAFIWIRAVDPHTIEYQIAKDEDELAHPKKTMSEPVRIALD